MNNLVILKFVSVAIIVSHSCDAYEYLYDQDNVDLSWLYGNDLYGQGFRKFVYNTDFDDYIPNSYRKSVHYQPIVSYHPRSYYSDTGEPYNEWNDEPLYVTYETLPLENKRVYFAPPSIETPTLSVPTNGYHYDTPQSQYLPPNKGPIPFLPQPKTPTTVYIPPNEGPLPFLPRPKTPDVPTTRYLPPTTVYLPPSRKPITTTTSKPTTKLTTTTSKPSTPKSSYLPPIIVPDPDIEYLPPISSKLLPPPISSAKVIRFN